jgi:hypothetical protein
VKYRINRASFDPTVVNADRAVVQAAQHWFHDTPADIVLDYDGLDNTTSAATFDAAACTYPYSLVVMDPATPFGGQVLNYPCVGQDRFMLRVSPTVNLLSAVYPHRWQQMDLQGLLVHEFGHVHELSHTNVAEDVMNPSLGWEWTPLWTPAFTPVRTSRFTGRRVGLGSAIAVAELFGYRVTDAPFRYDAATPFTFIVQAPPGFSNPAIRGPISGTFNRVDASCVETHGTHANHWSGTGANGYGPYVFDLWSALEEQTIGDVSTRTRMDGFGSYRRADAALDTRRNRKAIVMHDPLDNSILFGVSEESAVEGRCSDFFVSPGNSDIPDFKWIPISDNRDTSGNPDLPTGKVIWAKTMAEPSVTYDASSDRWLIAWAHFAPGCDRFSNISSADSPFCDFWYSSGSNALPLYNGMVLVASLPAATDLPDDSGYASARWTLMYPNVEKFSHVGPSVSCDQELQEVHWRCALAHVRSDFDLSETRLTPFRFNGLTGALLAESTQFLPFGSDYRTYDAVELLWSKLGWHIFYRGISEDPINSGNEARWINLAVNAFTGSVSFLANGALLNGRLAHAPGSGSSQLLPASVSYFGTSQ